MNISIYFKKIEHLIKKERIKFKTIFLFIDHSDIQDEGQFYREDKYGNIVRKWIDDDELIGSIPLEWNWLVGEYEKKDNIKNLHYTKGGPYFKNYRDCDYAEDWYQEYNNMKKVDIE